MRQNRHAAQTVDFVDGALGRGAVGDGLRDLLRHADADDVNHLSGEVEVKFNAADGQKPVHHGGFGRHSAVIGDGQKIISVRAIQRAHLVRRALAVRKRGMHMQVSL